jgi:hypothetical protein
VPPKHVRVTYAAQPRLGTRCAGSLRRIGTISEGVYRSLLLATAANAAPNCGNSQFDELAKRGINRTDYLRVLTCRHKWTRWEKVTSSNECEASLGPQAPTEQGSKVPQCRA